MKNWFLGQGFPVCGDSAASGRPAGFVDDRKNLQKTYTGSGFDGDIESAADKIY